MNTYATSDMHFDHLFLVEKGYRPFATTEEMNEYIIQEWNKTVKPGDTVYVQGDSAMGERVVSVPKLKALNGRKILTPGNHDKVHPMFADKSTYSAMLDLYGDVFDEIKPHVWELDDLFVMSHMPYNTGEVDLRGRDFTEWEPEDKGKVLLCGHVHEAWDVNWTDNKTLMINVGVDVRDFRPISMDEIHEIVKTLSFA